ncbi:GAF and ANTAR domain-containing protein [Mycobacterium sp. MYCO198283]|uniref:GAF and ANTAR domain-containing protein n=1 Tax=Mycobacterium sp. MYCO198283 TaxID=2883505 RepID=UPI001E3166E3|nr:GAF and ANTAR domain-containing protein [Mycobacterium sp. MYCO198283]MCG5431033.1 GAF and ANTAR domain-containing protein [Mycobacterium sp. MYCO198283]
MTTTGDVTVASVGELLRVARSIRELQAGAVAVEDVIREVTAATANALPGTDGAAVSVIRRRASIETLAATDDRCRLLDEIQSSRGEGPSVSAAANDAPVRTGDLLTDSRWPRCGRSVAKRAGIRSVLAVPVAVQRHTALLLTACAAPSDAFDDTAAAVVQLLATQTAVAYTIAQRDEQFRNALASRDVIGQAKGLLMERFGVDDARAFQLLKRLSQESNAPVAEIARKLVAPDRSR